jgi:hypothetical protein
MRVTLQAPVRAAGPGLRSRLVSLSAALSAAGLLATFGFAVCGLTSCGHDDDHGASAEVDEYFYDCEDSRRPTGLTVYATDESLVKMLEKEDAGGIVTKEEEAAVLLAPAAGATLSPATPPTFMLMPPATSAHLGPRPGGDRPLGAPSPRTRQRTLLQHMRRALAWLSPIGTAYAHCTPVTGDNYLLRLRSSDGKQIYAALLSVTTFTPTADVWQKALAGHGGQPLNLTLLRASYSGGTITAGPFVSGKAITFTAGM